MNSLITLISILTPLFLGFFIRVPKRWLPLVDKSLGGLVYLILALIGVSLSRVENLGTQMSTILGSAVLLFACVIGLNLLVLMWFDRRHPWQVQGSGRKANVSIVGSIKQLGCVLLGFVLGKAMHDVWLPSENLGTYCLMLLVLLVGIQLRSSGITLRQVLINLIRNAGDAMADSPTKTLTLAAATTADGVELSIADTGCGLPEGGALFEPFFTTKPPGEGLGLGLAISRDIVREFGGDLRADKRPEGGARFSLHLPAAPKEQP